MFSSSATVPPSSKHSQGTFGKNYAAHVPKGFSVRVFKGPTFSSLPYSATATFDHGYRPQHLPLAEPRQSQNWYYSKPDSNPKTYTAPSELSKSARFNANDSSTTASRSYEVNSKTTTPSYSIYPSVINDTYIYERSLSSKSDIYSNSECADSTATFSSSSAFSPALSTDSTTTLKSPLSSQATLADRTTRSSAPPLFSQSLLSAYIPALSQAHSAIRGIFRNPTPQDLSSRSDSSFPTHAPSTRPSALPVPNNEARFRDEGPAVQGRITTPMRLSSLSSGSDGQSLPHSTTSYAHSAAAGYTNQQYTPSTVSESDNGELDRLARQNAEYNAASSVYYAAREDPGIMPFHGVSGNVEPRRQPVYTNLPLQSSPEQHHYAGDSSAEASSSYFATPDTSSRQSESRSFSVPSYHSAQPVSEERLSIQSEEFIPPLARREWEGDMRNGTPAQGQPERQTSPQMYQCRSEDRQSHNYMAATRSTPSSASASVSSSESTAFDRHQERPLPIPPPSLSRQHGPNGERRMSMSQQFYDPNPPTSSGPNSNNPREGNVYPQNNVGPDIQRQHGPTKGIPVEQQGISSAPYSAGQFEMSRHAPLPGGRISNATIPPSDHTVPVRAAPEQERDNRIRRDVSDAGAAINYNDSRSGYSHYPTEPRKPPNGISSLPPQARTQPGTQSGYDSVPVRERHTSFVRNQSAGPQPPERHTASAERGRSTDRRSPTSDTLPSSGSTHQPSRLSSNIPALDGYSRSKGEPVEPARNVSGEKRMPDSAGGPPQRSFPGETPNPASGSGSGYPDHGQRQGQRRTSFIEPQRAESTHYPHHVTTALPPVNHLPPPERASEAPSLPQSIPSGARPTMSSSLSQIHAQPPPRSHTPFSEPRGTRVSHVPEPHRRHSDGDRSVNGDLPCSRSAAPHISSASDAPASYAPQTGAQVFVEPQRRFSDGDQVNVSGASGRASATLSRTVRWNETLVCPSPIFACQRKKGWFNRRGDQLWTNDGAYKPPPSGQEYPPELDSYPDHGQGWMNEEGVRIDMGHRLIPKPPLRSALKQSRA